MNLISFTRWRSSVWVSHLLCLNQRLYKKKTKKVRKRAFDQQSDQEKKKQRKKTRSRSFFSWSKACFLVFLLSWFFFYKFPSQLPVIGLSITDDNGSQVMAMRQTWTVPTLIRSEVTCTVNSTVHPPVPMSPCENWVLITSSEHLFLSVTLGWTTLISISSTFPSASSLYPLKQG